MRIIFCHENLHTLQTDFDLISYLLGYDKGQDNDRVPKSKNCMFGKTSPHYHTLSFFMNAQDLNAGSVTNSHLIERQLLCFFPAIRWLIKATG